MSRLARPRPSVVVFIAAVLIWAAWQFGPSMTTIGHVVERAAASLWGGDNIRQHPAGRLNRTQREIARERDEAIRSESLPTFVGPPTPPEAYARRKVMGVGGQIAP